MNKEELLNEMSIAARDLAGYASYSEIVGQIGLNKVEIRQACDKVFEIHRALQEIKYAEEEAAWQRKESLKKRNTPAFGDVSKEAMNVYGGREYLEAKAKGLILDAIASKDKWVSEAVDMICEESNVDREFFSSLESVKLEKYKHLWDLSNFTFNKDRYGKPMVSWTTFFNDFAPVLGWTWDLLLDNSEFGTPIDSNVFQTKAA